MRKASEGPRGKTRRSAPKTIDLAPSEVSEKQAAQAPQGTARPGAGTAADKPGRPVPPPAEPVAMQASNVSGSAGAQPASGTSEKPGERAGADRPRQPEAAASGRGGPTGHGSAGKGPAGQGPTGLQPKRTGMTAIVGAGIVGALISLAVLGGLSATGLLRYVPLLGGLAPRQEAMSPDPALIQQIVALDKRIAALEEGSGNGSPAEAIAGLSVELDRLGERLSAGETAIGELKELSAAGARDGGGTAAMAALSERVDALGAKVDGLEQELTQGAVAADSEASGVSRALDERIGAVAATSEALSASVEAVSGRVGALEAKLAELGTEVAGIGEASSRQAREGEAARAMAANALAAAYRRGEPFADLLASLEAVTGSMAAIDGLKAHAALGVATNDELKRGFGQASGQILAAVAPEEEGVISRLIANARSLVAVRPAGPVAGDSPQAIISRIEAGLDASALEAALAEWQTLPDAARDASAEWGEKLEKRVAADRLLQEVLAGLGQPVSPDRQ